MLQETTSTERSPRRRFWFDARFIIGIVLVVASIAGVWGVVEANDKTITVYSADVTLPAGKAVDLDDLSVVHVRLGDKREQYLQEGQLPAGDFALSRTVAAGELVPASAIVGADEVGVSPIVVEMAGELPDAVVDGVRVDVWAAEPSEGNRFGQPTVIVSGAIVSRVLSGESMMGQQTVSVEILVPKGALATVLSAHSNGYAISLVPTEGAA